MKELFSTLSSFLSFLDFVVFTQICTSSFFIILRYFFFCYFFGFPFDFLFIFMWFQFRINFIVHCALGLFMCVCSSLPLSLFPACTDQLSSLASLLSSRRLPPSQTMPMLQRHPRPCLLCTVKKFVFVFLKFSFICILHL